MLNNLRELKRKGIFFTMGLLGALGQGGKGCWHPAVGVWGLLQVNYKPELSVGLLCCGTAWVKC